MIIFVKSLNSLFSFKYLPTHNAQLAQILCADLAHGLFVQLLSMTFHNFRKVKKKL